MAEEAGEAVSCPRCGAEVKQKAMIPVLAEGGNGHRYLCRDCARSLIPADGAASTDTPAVGAEQSGTAPDGSAEAPSGVGHQQD